VMQVPRAAFAPLISRLKLMAGMDIAERRRPQDGRMAMVVQGEAVDVRVSAMPAMHGEKLVMRLLHRGAAQMGLEELNLAPDLLELIKETAESLQGIVLVTGPTGSGKTTSVYATLAELATITRNVITLEDPIEYELELVNQTQVNPQIGFTFAMGMRTVLRQDPDVLMVGEIRDLETAELAFEAAMTGHLVLSTVHTNDAPATIIRMSELGVERHLIASSLSLVLAQRLVRLVCEDCAGPDVAIPNERAMRRLRLSHEHLEGHNRRVGAGCTRCSWTGFRGRAAVIEALRVTPHIRELITDHASEEEVREYACSEGMRSMRQDGLIKAMKGMTTLEEVLRATPDDPRLDMPALLAHLGAGGDGLRTFRINRHTEPSRTPDR
jgi:type IV pilus assembly protein PilB